MSQPLLTLELPEDIYERIRRAAKGMNQPMEKALVNIVRAATPSLEKVPLEYRAELEAMEDLGDEDLWKLSQSRPAPAKQRRLEALLEKNQRGTLTDRERQSLSGLCAEGDRLTLQRSYASLLLKYRGHRLQRYENGGLNLANLTDEQQIEAEDDYRICVRRGGDDEGKPKKRQHKMKPEADE
jgi:hypothetical protein